MKEGISNGGFAMDGVEPRVNISGALPQRNEDASLFFRR